MGAAGQARQSRRHLIEAEDPLGLAQRAVSLEVPAPAVLLQPQRADGPGARATGRVCVGDLERLSPHALNVCLEVSAEMTVFVRDIYIDDARCRFPGTQAENYLFITNLLSKTS